MDHRLIVNLFIVIGLIGNFIVIRQLIAVLKLKGYYVPRVKFSRAAGGWAFGLFVRRHAFFIGWTYKAYAERCKAIGGTIKPGLRTDRYKF